jgi:hypothetical protein
MVALTPTAPVTNDFNLTQETDPEKVCLMPSIPPALKINSGENLVPS